MTLSEFRMSLKDENPPVHLSLALQGLWYDARGNWDKGHECAQNQEDRDGAWVHAYLHRKEGDLSNAGYWYRQAGRPLADGPLELEWEAIAQELLSQ